MSAESTTRSERKARREIAAEYLRQYILDAATDQKTLLILDSTNAVLIKYGAWMEYILATVRGEAPALPIGDDAQMIPVHVDVSGWDVSDFKEYLSTMQRSVLVEKDFAFGYMDFPITEL